MCMTLKKMNKKEVIELMKNLSVKLSDEFLNSSDNDFDLLIHRDGTWGINSDTTRFSLIHLSKKGSNLVDLDLDQYVYNTDGFWEEVLIESLTK